MPGDEWMPAADATTAVYWIASVRWPFFAAYTAICGLAVGAAALGVLLRAGTRVRLRLVAAAAFPLALAAPAAVVPLKGASAWLGASAIGVLCAVILALVAVRARCGDAPAALGGVMVAAAVAVAVAVPWGAELFPSTVFGYDPAAGMRLYGLGNETAALMVAWMVAGAASLAGTGARARRTAMVLAAGGILALGVAAWPGLGANLGVLAWGGVAVAVTVAGIFGLRPGWRPALAVAATILAVVLAFAWWDSSAAKPTHIGEAMLALRSGDWGFAGALAARRFETSWRVLTYSPLTLVPLAGAAALLRARVRPGPAMTQVFSEHPAMRAAVDGVLWATPVALLVEDSGVAVPALLFLFVACALLVAALSGGDVR